jgi:hypothetical protein
VKRKAAAQVRVEHVQITDGQAIIGNVKKLETQG